MSKRKSEMPWMALAMISRILAPASAEGASGAKSLIDLKNSLEMAVVRTLDTVPPPPPVKPKTASR